MSCFYLVIFENEINFLSGIRASYVLYRGCLQWRTLWRILKMTPTRISWRSILTLGLTCPWCSTGLDRQLMPNWTASSRLVRCSWLTAAWYRSFSTSVPVNIIPENIHPVMFLAQCSFTDCVWLFCSAIDVRIGSTVGHLAWSMLLWGISWFQTWDGHMITNACHSKCEFIWGSQKHGFVSVSVCYLNSYVVYYRVSKISRLTGSWIKCVLGWDPLHTVTGPPILTHNLVKPVFWRLWKSSNMLLNLMS